MTYTVSTTHRERFRETIQHHPKLNRVVPTGAKSTKSHLDTVAPSTRWAWRAYLVDQLKTVLVLRALVGEFNARRREGRGGGQNNRGGGEEGHSLKRVNNARIMARTIGQ